MIIERLNRGMGISGLTTYGRDHFFNTGLANTTRDRNPGGGRTLTGGNG